MRDIEHPDITQALKTGYPNMVAQPEHFGIDYFAPEGELILRENLEQYLHQIGFKFGTAE